MDTLSTILKELTHKHFTTIETYFNEDDELILYCENENDAVTITVISDNTFDIGVFINKIERYSHKISSAQVLYEIGKI